MEYWEAAAVIVGGISAALGAMRGASQKSKAIEEQLKPTNGEGTLATQVHKLGVSMEALALSMERQEGSLLETHHVARTARDVARDTHSEVIALFSNLPCQSKDLPCQSDGKGVQTDRAQRGKEKERG